MLFYPPYCVPLAGSIIRLISRHENAVGGLWTRPPWPIRFKSETQAYPRGSCSRGAVVPRDRSQKRGDTLVQWGDVLANTVNRCAQGEVTAQVDAAQDCWHGANGKVAPAHAQLSMSTGGERSSWLLAEAWWAEALTTPAYSQLVSWSVQSIPWALTVTLPCVSDLTRTDQTPGPVPFQISCLSASYCWQHRRVPARITGGPGSSTLLAVLLVIGRIPIPKLRSFIGAVPRKLPGPWETH